MSSLASEKVRVTKKFTFDMAHALLGHDGPCKNIHGHSYSLYVTLRGVPRHQDHHPKDGMIIDFSELKSIINQTVINIYDHALVLSKNSDMELLGAIKKQYDKIVIVPFQPSCENLIIEIKNKIKTVLNNSEFELISLRLDETATSYAEWFSSDNR
jgi:6-pyruvoyltetrahydropterin/6-carboxytetrahydropterin synthase